VTVDKPYQDPEWQRRLDQIAPPGGKLSYLHLYWEEGFDWEPVGRWMIGQVIPRASISPAIVDMLEGPNPADHGHFAQNEYGQRIWVTALPGISRRQWQFYRDTGGYLRPYWVVQGKHGGHRYQWTHTERSIIRMNGGNPEAPYPGQLCYAVPDERTYAELGKRDMLRQFVYSVDYMSGQAIREEWERSGVEEMRKHVWASICDQVKGYSDELEFHLRPIMDDAPRQQAAEIDRNTEELEHSFITEGA
jgi:hypothetical protein